MHTEDCSQVYRECNFSAWYTERIATFIVDMSSAACTLILAHQFRQCGRDLIERSTPARYSQPDTLRQCCKFQFQYLRDQICSSSPSSAQQYIPPEKEFTSVNSSSLPNKETGRKGRSRQFRHTWDLLCRFCQVWACG